MAENALHIIPLGGATEIGRNITAYHLGEQILVVDCGLMFPDQEMLGVDIVIPDASFLIENRAQVAGICLTHGHEDHIGALPYVLPHVPAPIYTTELTLGLVREKLKEYGLWASTEAIQVADGERVQIGDFNVEFVHVCHSIPGACSLVIRTPTGTVVHTSDFKFDQNPEDGKLTDVSALARAGDEGVLALVVDSTNVDKPGYVLSEATVREALDQVFLEASGRIIVTSFASNINRIQQVIDISQRYNRRVALAGRSMQENVRIARELGYLHVGEDTLIRLDQIEGYSPSEITIITTGSQGEPLSALTRMAMGDHRHVRIQEGDTVVFSATPIPGNEDLILRTINHLFKQGANVIDPRMHPPIHVSGHANREELKMMLNLTRPAFVVPVHGEYRHKELWRRMAGEMNYLAIHLENGDTLQVTPEEAVITEHVTAGAVFVDGSGMSGLEDAVLRDRWHLSQDGIVVVVCTVDHATGRLIAGPDVVARGAILTPELDKVTEEARRRTQEIIEALPEDGTVDWATVRTDVRRAINKLLQQTTGRRPMVVPILMEI
ncbi:MAG: ribonuclease J [Armatimonadetes bacterium]|nr:ribonuclease J [Armatimonadota bacterium]